VPPELSIPVERVAVYVVPGKRALVGVKIAPMVGKGRCGDGAVCRYSAPATAVNPNPACNVNVVVFMVEEFIASLNSAAKVLPVATPVAPFSGETEVTVGGGGGV
jgi:hypothetical protein